ncbi:hypothetical protein [Undibacterium terreum]|uniref:Uncharacterized protein n=1 Tax=Undibacterium terreum TaxID=1224302 RepID=A0A916XCQ9_9BURK|nr:hypothetical protein [Undibacterium terreum]GGC63934.1 hypothetical protein GCM10011396_08600 [Undibacterium terreum]
MTDHDDFPNHGPEATMKKIVLILACAFFALPAFAADTPAGKLIDDMQGVYKHRFTSGIISPGKAPGEADEKYEAEDIIEIVPYDASHIYLRAELQFYNGHSCSISGIAGYENGALVYHDPQKPLEGEPHCTLKVELTDKNLRLSDRANPQAPASCRMYCGARGSLSDYSIAKSAKRKIRYLDRLKASSEYAQAVEAFKKQAQATKP